MRSARLVSTSVLLAAVSLAVAGCGQNGTATVPDVKGKDSVVAYEVLHKVGLCISIDQSLQYDLAFTLAPRAVILAPGIVESQEPRAGRVVAHGSSVRIQISGNRVESLRRLNCSDRSEIVPDYVGKTLAWIDSHNSCFPISAAKLPPLHAARKSRLLENYEVVSQSPAPGTSLLPISASNPPGYTTLTVEVTRAR